MLIYSACRSHPFSPKHMSGLALPCGLVLLHKVCSLRAKGIRWDCYADASFPVLQMADLSAAADPGSGYLLGLVLGDSQACSMAAHHVCILIVYMEVLAFLLSDLCLDTDCRQTEVSLSGTIQVTPLTAPIIALLLQITLTIALPFFPPSLISDLPCVSSTYN